ncbi:MAG: DUF3376 domain-containing protein, partial [Alphaproteobacteria bacterium]|nr:DUF3376 domain-containing protein [Alphaproteobacteria bacterium]
SLYNILEDIKICSKPESVPEDVKKTLLAAFLPVAELDINDDVPKDVIEEKLADHMTGLRAALDDLATILHLDQYKFSADKLIAEQYNIEWESDLAKNLAISYIGFSFWDVTTFSIMGSRDLGEFNEIKINRISPKDVSILRDKSETMPLHGTAMGGFGAFFSREDRENDYLWGRISGAERLIDLLHNQAKIAGLDHKLDIRALKKRAFLTILDVEQDYLHKIPQILADLRKKINSL